MKTGIIYSIYNKESGKYYIGQTIHPLNKQWSEHLAEARRMKDTPLCRAIRKYGADKFNIRVIEECNSLLLDEREIYWIDNYDSCNNGYNETQTIELKEKVIINEKEEIKPIKKTIKRSEGGFTIRGDGKHSRVKVKTINVDTLEEKIYDSMTECANELGIATHNLSRYLKHGWKYKGHRIIKLDNKPKSYAIYGVDKITNCVKYEFKSIREAGRILANGNSSGCDKSLKHPHKYTWKGCYWFYK